MMEQIIDKLRKIKALADRGVAGEAKVAQAQLEKLLLKHGLTVDLLFDEEKKRRRFKVSSKHMTIFIQVCALVIGNRYKSIWHYTDKPSEKYVELTEIEYVDINQLFDFHKSQFDKEIKKAIDKLETAYVYKHDLFNKEKSDGTSNCKMTMDEYLAIMAMKDTLENVSFHKQLER